MNKGAILIGDNVLDGEQFSATPIGDWDGFENIYTPQLHPYATVSGQTVGLVIEKQLDSHIQRTYNALALLGIDFGIGNPNTAEVSLALIIDQWKGGQWRSVENYSAYILEATGASRNLIVLLPPLEYHQLERLRIRWRGARGEVVQEKRVGHVIAGTAIQDIDLADQGWSIRYIDQSEAVHSEGGQIYTASKTKTVRELTVTSASMSATTAYGVPEPIQQIPLSPDSAVLSGNARYDHKSNSYISDPGASGRVVFSEVLTPGKHYRLDYFNQTSDRPGELGSVSGWYSAGIFSSYSRQGTALCFIIGPAQDSDLSLITNEVIAKNAFRIVALTEVHPFPPGIGPVGVGTAIESSSIYRIISQHGKNHPVIFMIRPSDPILGFSTGIYGYLVDSVKITNQSGNRFRTGFTIREAR